MTVYVGDNQAACISNSFDVLRVVQGAADKHDPRSVICDGFALLCLFKKCAEHLVKRILAHGHRGQHNAKAFLTSHARFFPLAKPIQLLSE